MRSRESAYRLVTSGSAFALGRHCARGWQITAIPLPVWRILRMDRPNPAPQYENGAFPTSPRCDTGLNWLNFPSSALCFFVISCIANAALTQPTREHLVRDLVLTRELEVKHSLAIATGLSLADSMSEAPHVQWRTNMTTYIALCSFTDQGIRSIKDTTKRADAVKEAASKFGAKMTQIYWTLGQYDLISIIEAPDDMSATAFALAIGAAGNVRMQTLRAFSKDEMTGILAKMA